MNRTGLAVALAIAAAVGILFGVYPKLDLDLSGLFFDPKTHLFRGGQQPWTLYARDAARLAITLLAAPAVFALAAKLMLPQRRMLIPGRAAMFLVLTLALGPGILANVILKDHWARTRPVDVKQFGGTDRFTAWWDPRGPCPENCSFIAGEPSGAFWTLAPAALAPPQWRLAAFAGALVFGASVGILRISAGGHFFTDVVFAGVLMFLLIWIAHGAIYRWPRTRLSDEAVEGPLAFCGERARRFWAAATRRRGDRSHRRS